MSTQIPPKAAAATIIGFIVVIIVVVCQQVRDEPRKEEKRRADVHVKNAVVLSELAQRAHADTELAKEGKVRAGMITEQCRMAWGEPEHINRTVDGRGEHEQWVYGGGHYLYFDDEVLQSIQGIGRPENAPTLSAESTPEPVRHVPVAAATPARDPEVVAIPKPIRFRCRYGSVSIQTGAKFPFVSRTGDKSASAIMTAPITRFRFRQPT